MKKGCWLVLGLFLVVSLAFSVSAQEKNLSKGEVFEGIKEFEYQVSPEKNPEQWEELNTFSQKVEACRIPEEVLNRMSNQGLAEAVSDFPLLGNILVYDTMENCYKSLLLQCDALRALTNRKEGMEALADKYIRLIHYLGVESDERIYENYPSQSLSVLFLEELISNPEVFGSLKEETQYKVLNASVSFYEGTENSILVFRQRETYEKMIAFRSP